MVFLLPGVYGDDPRLVQFRISLAGYVNFVLIDYPDWHEMLAQNLDFDAMIDACIGQITDACQQSPLLLAGYSFGCCLAYEAARRLIRSSYRVHFLGLIDPPPPSFAPQWGLTSPRNKLTTSWWNKVILYIEKMRSGRSARVVFAEIREKLANRFLEWSVCRWPAPVTRVFFSSIVPLMAPELALSFKMRLSRALRIKCLSQWSPAALQVPTSLFRSDDLQTNSENSRGWAELCRLLTVVPIGGDHQTILKHGQLDLLSDCFRKAINAIVNAGARTREDSFHRLRNQNFQQMES
ncbi:MAG: hypothetical protein J2P49_04595 [Methylocapsa sp.]|nr:hypothetical protein [Methylocapsa sp.]